MLDGATTVVSDASLPAGCLLRPTAAKSGASYTATFNSLAASTATCASGGGAGDNPNLLRAEADLAGLTNLTLAHDGTTATITLSGPDGAWFAVGFDANSMADLPYALVVDGHGKVTERKLANHGPGTLLSPSVKVTSSTSAGGVRTVVLTRPVAAATKQHYAVPTSPGKVNVITAVGNTVALAYHKARSGAAFTLLPSAADSCLCAPTSATYLTYMDTSTQEFHYDCLDAPRSDMKGHGDSTGRPGENRACEMQTYGGGLRCCQHTFLLTDRGQDARIPRDKVDKYFLKWRYYFQEYVPATPKAPASHHHLHHWVFLIDATVNDYEEDNAHYGQASVGRISANLTAKCHQ